MLRMLIVGYCYGVRSERKLCEEVKLHPLPAAIPIPIMPGDIIQIPRRYI
jgi:hypothetical protein